MRTKELGLLGIEIRNERNRTKADKIPIKVQIDPALRGEWRRTVNRVTAKTGLRKHQAAAFITWALLVEKDGGGMRVWDRSALRKVGL